MSKQYTHIHIHIHIQKCGRYLFSVAAAMYVSSVYAYRLCSVRMYSVRRKIVIISSASVRIVVLSSRGSRNSSSTSGGDSIGEVTSHIMIGAVSRRWTDCGGICNCPGPAVRSNVCRSIESASRSQCACDAMGVYTSDKINAQRIIPTSVPSRLRTHGMETPHP